MTMAVIEIAGDAEHQGRHPGATQGGIVGGAGVDDALDVAGAELLGLFGESLAQGIGDPGGDVRTGTGQDADPGADHGAARDIDRIAPEQAPLALEDIADLAVGEILDRARAGDPAQDLADREHPDHHRDQADAGHQLDAAEGEARVAGRGVDADRGKAQADQDRDEPLQGLAGGDEDRAREAEQAQPEILERAEAQGELGQRRGRQSQDQGTEQPAHDREHESAPQDQLGLPLERQFVNPRHRRPRRACRECGPAPPEYPPRRSPWLWRSRSRPAPAPAP